MTGDDPFLMTLHHAAERVGRGVTQLDIEDAIEDGRLPYVTIGRAQIRVVVTDVDRVGPTIVHDDRLDLDDEDEDV
jgi:hypothetical protein